MDYISIGSTPCNEDCAQVGTPNYYERSRAEGAAFIQLIRDALGNEPPGARLAIKAFPHDFGTYHEVVVKFDETNEQAAEWAYMVEEKAPQDWMFNGKDYRPVFGDNMLVVPCSG